MAILDVLRHFLLPHHTNNQKAKLLHSSSIITLTLLLFVANFLMNYASRMGIGILGYKSNISIDQIVSLSNQKRAEAGLSPLVINNVLSEAAEAKGNDMLSKDYWAHVAPDGTEPWKFFKDVGYRYRYAGENLARDFSNADSAVEAWMASTSHRENILSSKYQEIGLAVVEGDLAGADTTIIVQLFGTKVDTTPAVPVAENNKDTASVSAVAVKSTEVETVKNPEVESALVPAKLPQAEVMVSPFSAMRSVSFVFLGVVLLILLIDSVFVSRRRISRITGRALAHLSFLGMVLAIVLILKAGKIM